MNWASVADFVAMGGYGRYVWGAYGVTTVCMLVDPIAAARRHRRALRMSLDEASDKAPDDAAHEGSNESSPNGSQYASDRRHEVAA